MPKGKGYPAPKKASTKKVTAKKHQKPKKK